jgi:hypothetical protein
MASLTDGIPEAEIPPYADLLVQASYGRAMMTAKGGYLAKQLNAAFQGLRLDPDPESDCRTPLTARVTVDEPREYLFRFYLGEGGRLVEVTPDALDSVKGRTLQFRSPLYCGARGCFCSRCMGTMFYRAGVLNVGLLASRIGTSQMAASLKAFHDTSLKLTRVRLGDYVKRVEDAGPGAG